ncbi:hypothetical protein AX14_013920 [Amanita brunnescens Koide BX004]|nr:hypothetical protein AX14_013920 [Amanita brunnescens Koide BX004]
MNAGTAITTSTKVWTSNSLEPEPLELMVSFCGKLPPNLRNRNMPLQITVSLPPEYAPYTRPVLRAVPTGYLEHTSDGISFTSDGTDEYMSDDDAPLAPSIELQEIPIPFLPLAPSFDHQDIQAWSELIDFISNWLVNDVKTLKRQEWTWGTDAFWMAFVAMHPSFPDGCWPSWDCRIALDGTFIQEWLVCGGRKGWSQEYNVPFNNSSDGLARFHDQIWAMFQSHINLFYISPVVH